MGTFKVACVQLRATRRIEENLVAAESLIREAHAQGAQYVLTPEQTHLMELERAVLFDHIRMQKDDEGLELFCALARELGLWLHIGSLAIKFDMTRAANRSFLINPNGEIAAWYDKVHMFDVDLAGGESYRESHTYRPGEQAVICKMPWGQIGMSICYDVRFPALYRVLAQGGAQFISVPAAFTAQTGKAHWRVLLRARAIETGCYIFAAAQGGKHENGRHTHGHSMIIDPWGRVLAEANEDPCVIIADVEAEKVEAVRKNIPSLSHDRTFSLEVYTQ